MAASKSLCPGMPINLPCIRLADPWQRGADMALRLLEEVCDSQDDAHSLDPTYREGPQHNAVHEYLSKLREIDDAAAWEGFGAVLTDWIATANGVDLDALQKLSRVVPHQ